MPDILTCFHVFFPYMSRNNFYMVPTFCTLRKILALFTNVPTAFVFTISVPVCCTVMQKVISRTNISIIILIVYILGFSEKAILCHGTFVRKDRLYSIIQKQFCYCRSFISGINDTVFHADICKLIVKTFKCSTVMLITRVYCKINNPSIFIACCFNPISKHMLVLAFRNQPLSGSVVLHLIVFSSVGTSSV